MDCKKEMTPEELLSRGYKLHDDILYGSDELYQKNINDKKGIKYFINIHRYKTNELNNYFVSLHLEVGESILEIKLSPDKKIIKEIEEACESYWKKLNAKYYYLY